MKHFSLILVMAFIILISISCVSASDNVNMGAVGGTNVSNIDNVPEPESYTDLSNDIGNIHSGDTYNFTRNYKFGDGYHYLAGSKVIKITQNDIVIDGNGFAIDAGGSQSFAIFNVLGNNVTIKNLIFANSQPDCLKGPKLFDGDTQYQRIASPITWQGNNGVLNNCTFCDNVAVNGGALNWNGNNGTINKCLFKNNIATGVGGALYIGGVNNTVSHCAFIDSYSRLTEEAVFLYYNRCNIRFTDNIFTNSRPIIDGAALKFDADYLYYSRMDYTGGDISTSEEYRTNLVPLLYSACVNGGINYNKNFMYSVGYNNLTHNLALNIMQSTTHNPKDALIYFNFDYLKTFCLNNITDLNHAFNLLIHGDYNITVTQNLIAHIFNKDDYNSAHDLKSIGYWFKNDKDIKLINGLTVKFERPCTINSDKTWNLKDMNFNKVTILGMGSTINGQAKDRDEKKWVEINEACQFIAEDLTVKKFNTAVICSKGVGYLYNIKFEENRMDYLMDRDWGAAIFNTAAVLCYNCSFMNNYAKHGGAIFNQGFLSLDNTTFTGNIAYGGKSNDVCVGDGGKVRINNENITSDTDHVYFAKSLSVSQIKAMKIVAVVSSFGAGFIVGVFTCNPFAGIGVGILIGSSLGTYTSCKIASSVYDANYNRGAEAAELIVTCALAGAVGGYGGYYAAVVNTPTPFDSYFLDQEAMYGEELELTDMESSYISFESEVSEISNASHISELNFEEAMEFIPILGITE